MLPLEVRPSLLLPFKKQNYKIETKLSLRYLHEIKWNVTYLNITHTNLSNKELNKN